MNAYMILASSDLYTETYDIYIDTVEAWTANEAIKKFFIDNFAFDNMGTIRGAVLCTALTQFKAVPILIDTSSREDAQLLIYNFYNLSRKEDTIKHV